MCEEKFSQWRNWHLRDELAPKRPGVYAIAYTKKNISKKLFSFRKEIIYIGMTNAVSGLRGRLKQFDNTVYGKSGHGGADRVRYIHRDYDQLVEDLYVAVAQFECDVTARKPMDLRTMGEVAKFEYLCLAQYVERHFEEPQFNQMASLKYSRKIGNDPERNILDRGGFGV